MSATEIRTPARSLSIATPAPEPKLPVAVPKNDYDIPQMKRDLKVAAKNSTGGLAYAGAITGLGLGGIYTAANVAYTYGASVIDKLNWVSTDALVAGVAAAAGLAGIFYTARQVINTTRVKNALNHLALRFFSGRTHPEIENAKAPWWTRTSLTTLHAGTALAVAGAYVAFYLGSPEVGVGALLAGTLAAASYPVANTGLRRYGEYLLETEIKLDDQRGQVPQQQKRAAA